MLLSTLVQGGTASWSPGDGHRHDPDVSSDDVRFDERSPRAVVRRISIALIATEVGLVVVSLPGVIGMSSLSRRAQILEEEIRRRVDAAAIGAAGFEGSRCARRDGLAKTCFDRGGSSMIGLRRRSALEEATVDMAPLIDMTFLLLIFFLVNTHFVKEDGSRGQASGGGKAATPRRVI